VVHEPTPFWRRANPFFVISGAFIALGTTFPFLIGEAEASSGGDLWRNGWIRLSFVLWIVGGLVFIWALRLHFAEGWKVWRNDVRATREKARVQKEQEEGEARRLEIRVASEAERERQSHRWRTRAASSVWNEPHLVTHVGHLTVALELRRPATSDRDEFKDRVAKCQVTRGAQVYSLNEPAKFQRPSEGFCVAFPQEFDNNGTLDPGEYHVTWYSDVLEEPRNLQFTIDRIGRLDDALSIT
jgi:hypothetical protein